MAVPICSLFVLFVALYKIKDCLRIFVNMNVLEIVILILLGILVITFQQFIRTKMIDVTRKTFDKFVRQKYEKRKESTKDNDTAQ